MISSFISQFKLTKYIHLYHSMAILKIISTGCNSLITTFVDIGKINNNSEVIHFRFTFKIKLFAYIQIY